MEPNIYRDFQIKIGRIAPKTRKYDVRVSGLVPGGLPSSDEKETRIFNPGVFLVETGEISINLLEAMKNRRITSTQLYQLGTILSDVLLPGSIRERLQQSLSIVRERKQRLRLRLIIEAKELIPLPWEYLYLKPLGVPEDNDLYFLALQFDISIVRHESIDQAEPRLEQRDQYRLVAALAAPSEQPKLKIEEDRKAIERMIEKVTTIGKVDPVWLEKATRQSLQEAFRKPADIFHFAGHGYFDGKTGQIILDKGDGNRSDYYDATLLAGLLSKASVKLAILGACETAQRSDENIWGGVAPSLVRAGLAAVVASQYRLQDRNAVPLAEELYRGVLAGDSVDEAVYNARWSIYQQAGLENRDWGAPVLYLRVEDGIIFPRQAVQTYSPGIVPRVAPTPLLMPLVGRDDELATAQAEFRNGSKYYFYGTYGVGKTSLVTALFTQAVKQRTYEDGYLWFRVADMDVESVLEWIASHFPGQQVSQTAGQVAKINALRELLAQHDNLLIGMDEVSDFRVVRALLEAAGNCTLMLNGPRRFNLDGQAQEFELAPLSPDEAEQLFLNLAHRPPMALQGEELEIIRKICARMQYLPLAIKLAALKHAEGESLETLWERLQRAPVTVIPEHEEVSAIFDTIYHDLQETLVALRLLVRLVCFPALEAALAPLRANFPDLDFFQAKDKLIALGLVGAVGSDRLSLHPLLGLLAQQKAAPLLLEAEREQVASWLLNYAQRHVDDYGSLEKEHQNLLGILDWFASAQKYDELVTLTCYLFDYLRVRGHWQDAIQRLNTALQAAQTIAHHSHQAWIHLHRGIVYMLQGDYETAKADFDQADLLYIQEGDLIGEGQVLYRRATLNALTDKLSEAQQEFVRALELMGEEAPARDRAGAWQRLASIVAVQGYPDQARKHYHFALVISRDANDLEGMANVYLALGGLSRRAGNYNSAREHFQNALTLTKQLGHLLDTALIEWELGYLDYYQGRYSEALIHFQHNYNDFQQLRDKRGQAQTLQALGNVAFAQRDFDGAEEKYRAALSINHQLNNVLGIAYNQYQLGLVAQRRGKRKEAEITFRAALRDAKSMKDVALQAASLHQLGTLSLSANDWESAQEYERQALDLATQVEDRLTELAARYQLGLLQVKAGNLPDARDILVTVQDALAALNAPEAAIVDRVLSGLFHLPIVYYDFNLCFGNYDKFDSTFKVWVEGETPGGTLAANEVIQSKYDPAVLWIAPEAGGTSMVDKLAQRTLDREAMFFLGTYLADLALPKGPIRDLFYKSLAALNPGEGLRIRLHIDSEELVQLPWEYLALPRSADEPHSSDFLVLRRETSIVRTNNLEVAAQDLPNRDVVRIVGILSNPEDLAGLNVDRDKEAVESAVALLNQGTGRGMIKMAWTARPSTPERVEQALAENADIFYYIGKVTLEPNTKEGKIVLENADYTSYPFSSTRLAHLLREAGTRLVVLEGYRTGQNVWEPLTKALTSEKIPAVIENRFKIESENAALLTTKVCRGILAGYTVDEALYEARQAIFLRSGLGNRDWGTPVLYLQDIHGILFPRKETDSTSQSLTERAMDTFSPVDYLQTNIVMSGEVDVHLYRVLENKIIGAPQSIDITREGNILGVQIDVIKEGTSIAQNFDVVKEGGMFPSIAQNFDELG